MPTTSSPPLPAAVFYRIPQVQGLLDSEQGRKLCERFGRTEVRAVIRARLDDVRRQLRAGAAYHPECFSGSFFMDLAAELERRAGPHLVPVINATGVVLHTNLGRAPLAGAALAQLRAVAAGYNNLEFDLDLGTRGSRMAHVEERLCRLTGAEAALVVNNCASAVLLALSASAQGGEVVVSRGELVEIGGGFRIPDVIAQSGARLVEVGTTNKTRRADYARAISAHTRALLKTHPSNYRVVGFTETVPRAELARLAREHGLCFIEDLGSGSLVDLRRYGLPYEPTVQDCLHEGADLVLFSGDKLLGGPQAGLIVGSAEHVARLSAHPLMRALRADKLVLAALEATLRLYESGQPEDHLPILRMFAESPASLTRRARSLVRRLAGIPGLQSWTERGFSLPGGGSLPQARLPTCLVKLRPAGMDAGELSRRLRLHRPALVARVADGCLVLDLRTVERRQVAHIATIIAAALT